MDKVEEKRRREMSKSRERLEKVKSKEEVRRRKRGEKKKKEEGIQRADWNEKASPHGAAAATMTTAAATAAAATAAGYPAGRGIEVAAERSTPTRTSWQLFLFRIRTMWLGMRKKMGLA